jgi:hypothetical protein
MPKHRKEHPVKEQVGRRMTELKGRSRSDLMSDKERGPVSSLGHGHGAKEPPKRKGR